MQLRTNLLGAVGFALVMVDANIGLDICVQFSRSNRVCQARPV